MAFVMDTGLWSLYYVLPGANEVRKIVPTLAVPPLPGALAFTPVTGDRVFDSRSSGADTGLIRAGTSRLIKVVAAQGNHRAALVNLTMVRPLNNSFLTAWQARTAWPTASNLNVHGGQTAANASIVPIDADGNVLVFTNATTHVVVDVLGFFDVAAAAEVQAGRLTPVTPVRAIDTRNAADSATNPYARSTVGNEGLVNVPLAGRYGLAANVSAVAVIVTALSDARAVGGNVVAYPHGGAVPAVSNVNTSGLLDRRANLVLVPLGADGSIDLGLRNVVDVIVDVIGAFTDGAAPQSAAGLYVPITATRVVDTRVSLGFAKLAAATSGTVNSAAVPDSALAVAQNVVIVNTVGAGFVTAYPAGLSAVPLVSFGNAVAESQVRSTITITPTGTGVNAGGVTYYTSMASDLVVDIPGYFQAAPA
jgi:hypothetical protein